MKKFLFVWVCLIVLLFTACDRPYVAFPYIGGTWEIKSLMANGEEYLYDNHVCDYMPDIAKSVIVFGEHSKFELSFVYVDEEGITDSYVEIHKGTYTLNGNTIEFKATECTKGGSNIDVCQFRGELDGSLLRISKSFAAGELKIIPIADEAVAVNVIFKLIE